MTIYVPGIERKAELNIQRWLQAEKTNQRFSQDNLHRHVGPYLALSREAGAGGSEVARKVAERLKWDVLDQEIVDYMEEHYGTPRCLIRRVDERHENWLSSMITAQIGGLGYSECTYTHRVAKLLMLAASHGDVVIVGRGATFILPRHRGLSVRIVAALDHRIERVMKRRGISEKEAHRYVLETDHARSMYIKSHFGQNAADPHVYDLVLNAGKDSLDDVVDTIVDSMGHFVQKQKTA
ncbi:cytidylate kinase-like family protein [Stieleria varia]|uniref:Cytidylate kinase n=1 Tax=Stieleria varia TaxID=2528005 RepID=A0A5C6A5Y8_9BACT|nr:cytidylate kinase-like family protein [Stieleria varia]TWT94481.1 cytidylate kinase [Stieleria varia]